MESLIRSRSAKNFRPESLSCSRAMRGVYDPLSRMAIDGVYTNKLADGGNDFVGAAAGAPDFFRELQRRSRPGRWARMARGFSLVRVTRI